jgi:hypothetical protein
MNTMPTNALSRTGNWIRKAFGPDERYEGVYKINLYLLRLMFVLILIFVARDSWTTILTHQGPWDPLQAVAYCVWAAYSTLFFFGLFQPLKWLPLVLFEIAYKAIWLAVVAYPLWASHQLAGSPAEPLTDAFLWLPLPLLAVPWGYTFRTYFRFWGKPKPAPARTPARVAA